MNLRFECIIFFYLSIYLICSLYFKALNITKIAYLTQITSEIWNKKYLIRISNKK